MGAVYEATDLRLHNTVAVKQMTAVGHDAGFEQEARLLAALRHAGLPLVSDYFADGEMLYLVMQYIEGEDLGAFLRRAGRAAEEGTLLRWTIAVLDVLIYLHERSHPIIHRDVKPANIKLTPAGEIVLLDFGLAKGRAYSDASTVEHHSVHGFTRGYAPIEQIEGTGTDARSDIYALGASLFHLATGVWPVSSEIRAAADRTGRPDPLPPVIALNPRISKAFSDILSRAVALRADDRFSSAREMRAAVAKLGTVGRATEKTQANELRRVDAAMPSQATVAEQIDLLVQVRFDDSPRLGLEDWPTARRPTKIEQTSESMRLQYPRDHEGSELPARVKVSLLTRDFTINGPSERVIEVPPDDYSQRVAFLIAPNRVGVCRVNVEVHALDALYLGTVLVELDALAASAGSPVLRVANLVFTVFSRQRTLEGRETHQGLETHLRAPRRSVLSNAIVFGGAIAVAVVGGVAVLNRPPRHSGSATRNSDAPTRPPGPSQAPAIRSSDNEGAASTSPARTLSTDGKVQVEVISVERLSANRVRIGVRLTDLGITPAALAVDTANTRLLMAGTEYLARTMRPPRTNSFTLPQSGQIYQWIEFRVRAEDSGVAELRLATIPGDRHVRFDAIQIPVR